MNSEFYIIVCIMYYIVLYDGYVSYIVELIEQPINWIKYTIKIGFIVLCYEHVLYKGFIVGYICIIEWWYCSILLFNWIIYCIMVYYVFSVDSIGFSVSLFSFIVCSSVYCI